jgi:hypothetical protein
MRQIAKLMSTTVCGACLAGSLAVVGCGGTDDIAQPTPTPTVSLANLVLLMHFEEAGWSGAAGEVVDSSGLANNGTAVGGARIVAEGKFGRAGSFDTYTGVRIADTAYLRPTDQLTVSAWVNPTAGVNDYRGIVAKRVQYGEKNAYTLHLFTDGKPEVDVDTEDDRATVPVVVPAGVWSHLALVYDGRLASAARVSVYLNGQLAGTLAERSASIQPFDSPLWIGCLPQVEPAYGFRGLIDEVAIWHRALSTQEIQLLTNATTPLAK